MECPGVWIPDPKSSSERITCWTPYITVLNVNLSTYFQPSQRIQSWIAVPWQWWLDPPSILHVMLVLLYVVDSVKVIKELSPRVHGCAVLFGLIYAPNLKYPPELKHIFKTLQHYSWKLSQRWCHVQYMTLHYISFANDQGISYVLY